MPGSGSLRHLSIRLRSASRTNPGSQDQGVRELEFEGSWAGSTRAKQAVLHFAPYCPSRPERGLAGSSSGMGDDGLYRGNRHCGREEGRAVERERRQKAGGGGHQPLDSCQLTSLPVLEESVSRAPSVPAHPHHSSRRGREGTTKRRLDLSGLSSLSGLSGLSQPPACTATPTSVAPSSTYVKWHRHGKCCFPFRY